MVVGHWSKDKTLVKEHFNFSSAEDRCNVLKFTSLPSEFCPHAAISVKGLLNQLVSILSYPGQVVIEMFPETVCGKFNS